MLLVLCFGVVGGIFTWRFFDLVRDGLAWAKDLPGRMMHQEINESFRQSVTEISSNQGDVLEVATMTTDETISKFDSKMLFNNLVHLGTTVSEIRTPVVYRYHIKLSDPAWQVIVKDQHCVVHAPPILPSLPPAIRTEHLEKKSDAGWLRFNASDNLSALEKELTPTLEKRAGNRTHIDLVREAARKSVAEFVKRWLLREGAASTGEVKTLTVIFPDEQPVNGARPAVHIQPETLKVP